jgi:hypothetical protein
VKDQTRVLIGFIALCATVFAIVVATEIYNYHVHAAKPKANVDVTCTIREG